MSGCPLLRYVELECRTMVIQKLSVKNFIKVWVMAPPLAPHRYAYDTTIEGNILLAISVFHQKYELGRNLGQILKTVDSKLRILC